MIDPYYTPPELAQVMVDLVPKSLRVKSIADFAAGEGSLLHAALTRWPKAVIYANDLSKVITRRLARLNPNWEISTSNFLETRSTSRAKFNSQRNQIDLILINPPFSERSRRPISWLDMGADLSSGVTMAFLYKSLNYLSPRGLLVAVLPDGCLASERDKKAWEEIYKSFEVEVIRDNCKSAFKGVSARTSLVRVQKRQTCTPKINLFISRHDDMHVEFDVIRGRTQMHRFSPVQVEGVGLPLVHTSELLDGTVALRGAPRVAPHASITGSAVLFPRVGRVTPQKVAILRHGDQVVLSDCVLGVMCKDDKEACTLRNEIIAHWAIFANAYRGTGAPYITVSRANEVLRPIIRGLRDKNTTYLPDITPIETVIKYPLSLTRIGSI